MDDKKSLTKLEKEVLPGFKKGLSRAESTEDIKKVFYWTVRDLLSQASDGRLAVEDVDLDLHWEAVPFFRPAPGLRTRPDFKNLWAETDLERILERIGELAANRYRHLLKSPDKTESKMHRSGRSQGRPV